MRKILLATTALVAMTGAASAEVSLSAYYEFGYTSSSDDRTDSNADQDAMFQDSEYHITFSEATDSGLTFSAKFEAEGGVGDGVDESSMTISSDMGSFVFGNNDYASDSFLTYIPGGRGTAVGADNQFAIAQSDGTVLDADTLASNPNHAQFTDNMTMAYFSPNMGGVSVGLSVTDEGDNEDTAMGISWSGDAMGSNMTLTFANFSNGETTETKISAAGISFAVGSASVGASTATTDDGTDDTTTSGIGVGFDISSDLSATAAIASSEDDTSGDELETVSLSATYTIAPGLSLAMAYNTYAYADAGDTSLNNDADEVVIAIQANF